MKKINTRVPGYLIALVAVAMITQGLHAQLIAFPGAEGYGKYVSGGRGGDVIAVTNLLDDPADPPEGSFRWALQQKLDTIMHPVTGAPVAVFGPTTIVFRVSGIIELQAELESARNDLTIAGQTAPGDGICLKDHGFTLRGDNVIIRYLRFRPGTGAGEAALSPGIAGLSVENCNFVMVDHCSFGWANEEDAIFYDNHYTTVQWCIAHEGLYNAFHHKGVRSYCGVWGGQKASFHHNLIAHNYSRTIRFNGARAHDTSALVDYRNNVVYNWGRTNACYGGEVEIPGGYSRANLVNNYYKPGPATSSSLIFLEASWVTEGNTAHGTGQWYIDGNVMVPDENRTNDNWLGVSFGNIPVANRDIARSSKAFRVTAPLPTQTAEEAYEAVLEMVGAVYPKRDTIDARIVYETMNGTASGDGQIGNGIIDTPDSVGGYPEYLTYDVPDDADGDGMDDAWELSMGLDPGDPEDRNDIHETGYTMLEMYLNGLVEEYTQILDPVVFVKGIRDDNCIGTEPYAMTGSPRGGFFREGVGLTVYGDSVIFEPSDTGNYEMTYVYSDGEGFSDSVKDVLVVHPLPDAAIAGLDTVHHVGDIIPISGDPSSGTFLPGDGIIVKPAGEAIFKPTTAGDYEVFYQYSDQYGCTVIVSREIKVSVGTGISGEQMGSAIGIYPNPAGDEIRIAGSTEVHNVRIFDLSGKEIISLKGPAVEHIRTADLDGGIYFVHIETEKGTAVRKFVKQ